MVDIYGWINFDGACLHGNDAGSRVMVAEFDYVVVGAGSAGCVLAARLTAAGARVLILEAGGWDRDPWIHIPLGWGKILQKRLHDWMYFCEPEPNVDNRRVECARGKVIGGSSSINAMAYVRGNRRDFDRWAESGLPGWSYQSLLPYFRRSESWEGGESTWRGGHGPLSTQFCTYRDPLVDAFGEAGRALGHPWTEDYNGEKQEGFGRLQMTIKDGRRCSGATAYLRPAMRRGGLTVVVHALVTKILIEGSKAVGIEYRQDGALKQARAATEVILAGGVINSPQLLMLSGIGDPNTLKNNSLPVLSALPGVGQNLQDHMSAVLTYRRKEPPGPFHKMMRMDRIGPNLVGTYLFGKGTAADVPGGVTAFLKTPEARDTPDLQYLFTAAPFGAWPYLQPFKKPFPDGFATRVVSIRPDSRGHLALASADPAAPMRIHQNFMATDRDWRVLRAGVRLAREIAAQPAMAPFVANELAPGAGKVSDAEIDAHIRATAITVHHPLGTCRMGTDRDARAVVDENLNVHGIERLRVVDASVMPDMVCGNINAAVVAIAERASDLIIARATSRDVSVAPAAVAPS